MPDVEGMRRANTAYMEHLFRGLDAAFTSVVSAVVMESFMSLVDTTYQDSGQAAASWQITRDAGTPVFSHPLMTGPVGQMGDQYTLAGVTAVNEDRLSYVEDFVASNLGYLSAGGTVFLNNPVDVLHGWNAQLHLGVAGLSGVISRTAESALRGWSIV